MDDSIKVLATLVAMTGAIMGGVYWVQRPSVGTASTTTYIAVGACNGIEDGTKLQVREDTSTCGWPFVPDRATIACDDGPERGGPVTVTFPDGRVFGLNGRAQTRLDLPDMTDDYQRHYEGAGGQKSYADTGKFVEAGLALCPA